MGVARGGEYVPMDEDDDDYRPSSAWLLLDDQESDVTAGDSVFIPAGAVHGTVNTGSEPLEVRAVYPSTVVRVDYAERNPRPGTEQDAPKATRYDLATGAFEVLGDAGSTS